MPLRTALLLALIAPALALAEDAKPKPQNDLIGSFVDEPESFKGKTVTFRLTFRGNASTTLRDKVGETAAFTGVDAKNGAKLALAVEIPKGLKVPNAKYMEEVLVTFKCTAGTNGKGNVAVRIDRP